MIKKGYPDTTFTYQRKNLCRKCARKQRLMKLRLENRKLSLKEKMAIAKKIGIVWEKEEVKV